MFFFFRMSTSINKEWMHKKDRVWPIYTKGVEDFLEFAFINIDSGLTTLPCPCVKCRNRNRHTPLEVRKHLVKHGIDSLYSIWVFHGEKPYMNSIDHAPVEDVHKEENIEFGGLGMDNLVDASYGMHREANVHDDSGQAGVSKEPYIGNEKYNDYKRLSTEKLYPSCEGPETTLSAIVELHNIKKQFGWSGNSVITLLEVLKRWLPKGNTLPDKYPHMKSMMKDLGMKANFI